MKHAVWRFHRFPPEAWLCAAFGVLWTGGVAVGLPVSIPDRSGFAFVTLHYLHPLLLASAIQLALALVVRHNGGLTKSPGNPYLMAKLLPVLAIAVFIHFNFKAWMPLVSHRLYDPIYQRMDIAAAPVVTFFHVVRGTIASLLPMNVDAGYSGLFLGMFVVSVVVHSVVDSSDGQRRLILGICMILLVGGLAYWIAPAVGPFIYKPGVSALASAQQETMYREFRYVQERGSLPEGYFAMPLAAMPSLHISHALFLTLSAAVASRWLLIVYVPVLLWITIESVASGWHYLVDLPVGIALALLCLAAVKACIPSTNRLSNPISAEKQQGVL
ncbi:MAG: phosphatase PAP2 family protein [Gemmatimonadaceae bacterium]